MKNRNNLLALLGLSLGFILFGLLSCKKSNDNPLGVDEIDLSKLKPLVTQKGLPHGTFYSKEIGAGGGIVESPDGQIRIEIPAGALSGMTTIGVQPISNTAPLGAGNSFRLTPEGINFAKPVKISMKYQDGLPAPFVWIVAQKTDGTWIGDRNSEVNETAKTVTVQTTHFSNWAIGKLINLILRPENAMVKVKESVKVHITGFYAGTDDDLMPLVPIHDPSTDELAAIPDLSTLGKTLVKLKKYSDLSFKNWKLSPSIGSLKTSGSMAEYTAPNSIPTPDNVTISVDVDGQHTSGVSKVILFSNIKIIDKYFARFTIDGVESVFSDADILKPDVPPTTTGNMAQLFYTDGTLGINLIHAMTGNTMTISLEEATEGSQNFVTSSGGTGALVILTKSSGGDNYYHSTMSEMVKSGSDCTTGALSSGTLTLTGYRVEKGAVISGTFSGKIWSQGDPMACKNRRVSISGDFVMPLIIP